MRWLNIGKNIFGYNDQNSVDVRVDDRVYVTSSISDFKPSLVLGCTFEKGIKPGAPNHKIARSVIEARQLFSTNSISPLPIIAQREIFDWLKKYSEIDGRTFGVCDVLTRSSFFKTDVSTRDVLKEAGDIIYSQGIDPTGVVYVAHPAHVYRVMEMGKRVSIDGIGLEGIPFVDKNTGFDPDNDIKGSRGRYRFAFREVGARIHHKLKNYI